MKYKIGGIKIMKGRGVDSEYLITRLFSMDYFHYFSKPLIFAAYFFPFVALGKGIIRAYTPGEFEEKIANIRENKHGNYYNYATQGFGTTPFYEPDVSYAYFYSKLCTYDQEKGNYFEKSRQPRQRFPSRLQMQQKDKRIVRNKKHKPEERFIHSC